MVSTDVPLVRNSCYALIGSFLGGGVLKSQWTNKEICPLHQQVCLGSIEVVFLLKFLSCSRVRVWLVQQKLWIVSFSVLHEIPLVVTRNSAQTHTKTAADGLLLKTTAKHTRMSQLSKKANTHKRSHLLSRWISDSACFSSTLGPDVPLVPPFSITSDDWFHKTLND